MTARVGNMGYMSSHVYFLSLNTANVRFQIHAKKKSNK